MTKTTSFDRGLQSDVLTTLRTRSGLSRTQVAARINMDHDTYRRYETGQTELRTSQVRPFAEAYGVSPRTLSEALGLLEDDVWDFCAALRGQIQEDQIAAAWAEWHDAPIQAQKGAASAILAEAERRRSEPMAPPKPAHRRRARSAENRSA